ncbi:alpha/beta fold hydrolase [Alkalihalobacillus pseudalcaliphilus]|uniref:alpha/beta hydrolase n=1 Tax=Alkalihalobacillus pseudalcaliphilus TaxID=79884 RepID=UPI00064D824F|nr:alpha/beta fold hydrolase [Alkalihalobacillus pseudalcaliphilus]KMK78021.1 hypothetical protein AB990_00785 [Alkalihalobacillus pseudalcaliphilus]
MKRIHNGWLILLVFLLLVACSVSTTEKADDIIAKLFDEEYEVIVDSYFADELKERLTVDELREQWETIHQVHSHLENQQGPKVSHNNQHDIVEYLYDTEQGTVKMRMIFDESKQLTSLNFSDEVIVQMPEGVMEEEVTVGEGNEFELGGTITVPSEIEGKIPVVVIVHGSGPNNRDGEMLELTPYRDIAWGLAERGIASIRYDKRTLIYPEAFMNQDFTWYEETVDDAVLAAEIVSSDDRFDQVYLVGHSLGGMAGPVILSESDRFDGFISLAGSLRSFSDIIMDQFEYLHQTGHVPEEQLERIRVEYEKSKKLHELDGGETVFGLPVTYLNTMEDFRYEAFFEESKKPIFIVQGEDDYQVTFKDYQSWQEALENYEPVTFQLYPGLNHFFVHYEGPHKGTPNEYGYGGSFSEDVLDDMARWME